MKKSNLIYLLSILMLATACIRENLPVNNRVPEGSPVTLTIGFGATTPVEVNVGTKAEATAADESRVHDLYVMIFDNAVEGKPRTYGRYFNYEHRWLDKAKLSESTNENEGWYVQNKTMDGAANPVEKTLGAVKIATVAHANCTLVLLANVDNALVSLDGKDPLTALNAVTNLSELRDLPVRLEQNVVDRNDLFLMAGEIDNLNMTVLDGSGDPDMTWNRDKDGDPSTDGFGNKYRVTLSPIDAKVKFRIRANETNIKELTPTKWTVFNVPTSCYLFPTNAATGRNSYVYPSGDSHYYFDMDPVYFDTEETETVGGQTVKWYTFTFYMLESCLPSSAIPSPDDASSYYLREKKENGAWKYAPEKAPYVTFGVSMTLTDVGIDDFDNLGPDGSKWGADNQKPIGVTGEMTYTVHLGDFAHPDPNDATATVRNANDYNTKRGFFYSYDITLNNAANLFAEVKYFQPDGGGINIENQPGQEGSLLLFSGGTVNCDAHYEYRMMTFQYSDYLATKLMADEDYNIYSWYVVTPFNPNGAKPTWVSGTTHRFVADPTTMDYLWVKFAVNKLVGGVYSEERVAYPGEDEYDVSWFPGKEGAVPKLMDINQLMNYIYYQHRQKKNGATNIFDTSNLIRLTAFVDEYYYERDPFSGAVNPDLWRQFINAEPREMYILSDVQESQDQQSNLVNASHSIIQRSIQTIYNVNAPDLTSLWGIEHIDEIRQTLTDSGSSWDGWDWGVDYNAPIREYVKSEDNGRINSAALWGLYPAPDEDHDEWTDFLKYDVVNTLPELKDADHRKMAYSCLTRNRDNNGNGFIDPEEVRWYMASINQLKGLWIGNESLTTSARVYQPWLTRSFPDNWRAHILSSTCPSDPDQPKVLNAEEGSATFDYGRKSDTRAPTKQSWCQGTVAHERLRESVRCVRNVGTYSVGGATLDISDAPYGLVPDNYFTVTENVDPNHSTDHNYSTYTIQFMRLDPRSLREFSNSELPFHDEKSSNNRVYLELHTQSRASRSQTPGYADTPSPYIFPGETAKIDMGQINETITNEGHNKYCPAGYRFPNQKEMAMMSLSLPASYWNTSVIRIPSRTFYSRGYYGDNSDRPNNKLLGFSYNPSKKNIFLPDKGQEASGIRCVRDNDLTGTILGSIYLSDSILMPGESTDINFNFTSSAASFKSGALYVCYRDTNGNPVETQIPLNRQPNGMQYITTQKFVAPDPASLNPSPGARPTAMTLRLVLKNTKDDTEYVFETPFTVAAVDIHCDFELLPGSDETLGFPIRVHAAGSDGAKIKELTLSWKTASGDWSPLEDHTTGLSAAVDRTEYGTVVYFDPPTDNAATYFFKLEAKSNSASDNAYSAAPKSMQFVEPMGFHPNPLGSKEDPVNDTGDFHYWKDNWWQTGTNANDWLMSMVGNVPSQYNTKEPKYVIKTGWRKKILNLNFAAGDYIEVDMDLAYCVYIDTGTDNNNQKPGLDNIFSIGRSGIGWDPSTLHVYYPAHVPYPNSTSPSYYQDELRFYAVPSNTNDSDNSTIGRVHEYNGERPMLLRFDKDGITYNSMALNWKGLKYPTDKSRYNNVVSTLTAGTSVYIGAEEGDHLSRAIYKYVRVVRVELGNVGDDPTGGFDDNPHEGGNL